MQGIIEFRSNRSSRSKVFLIKLRIEMAKLRLRQMTRNAKPNSQETVISQNHWNGWNGYIYINIIIIIINNLQAFFWYKTCSNVRSNAILRLERLERTSRNINNKVA